jgi:hypothetical protein
MSVTQKFNGLKEEVRESFAEKIVALRRDIHREPELGFDTRKTAEKVLAAIEGLPLDVQTGVAENGIVATLKGEKKAQPWGSGRTWTRCPSTRRRGCRLLRR